MQLSKTNKLRLNFGLSGAHHVESDVGRRMEPRIRVLKSDLDPYGKPDAKGLD